MAEPHEDHPGRDGLRVCSYTQIERDKLAAHLAADEFFWLDLQDPAAHEIETLARLFSFHPLALEDTSNFGQRPKLDDYDSYVFLVFYGAAVRRAPARGEGPDGSTGHDAAEGLLTEMHMFVSGSYMVTIHHGPSVQLDDLRKRISGRPLRSEQALIYQVLDTVSDTFFPLLEQIDDEIDAIEDAVIADPSDQQLQRIFTLKRDLVALRRVVTPQRDMFARSIERISDLPGLDVDARDYFRDLYDHLIRISDLVDSYRDLLSGATDMHLSTVANRQGEVAKQLTVIATIFLPLTFLTGFFGQNFTFLTNHVMTTTLSFLLLGIGTLVASCLCFLVFFKRRGWL